MAEDAVALPERVEVSFEDDPTVAREEGEIGDEVDGGRGPSSLRVNEPLPYKAGDETAVEKPSMRDGFGPGGFLERCMIGGYEHRRGQLEMAEMVHDAFEKHHHAILEAGTGTGKTLA